MQTDRKHHMQGKVIQAIESLLQAIEDYQGMAQDSPELAETAILMRLQELGPLLEDPILHAMDPDN